jgi:hypothetical protein
MSAITIQCRLMTSEETRRYLWQLTAQKNTPLVNELLKLVSQHPDFEAWRRRGTLPGSAVKQLCQPLRQDPRFVGQPGRFYSSAIRIVQQTYEAWIVSNRAKQASLDGKKRWVETVESDAQLAEMGNFSPEAIYTKAREILEQVSTPLLSPTPQQEQPKRAKKNKEQSSVINTLFELLNATEDLLSRRAIIHLLKHGCQVNEQEEDPEKLFQLLASKRQEIKRLEEQLQARYPRGRACTEEEAQERVMRAIGLPEHPGLMCSLYLSVALLWAPTPSSRQLFLTWLLKIICEFDEGKLHSEFLEWEENFPSNRLSLMRSPKNLPYPILYGAEDLTKWFRNEKGRICLSFNGLSEHTFELQCDRRQLSLFGLFMEDWQTLRAKENQKQYSGSKLLLRDAALFWQEATQKIIKKKSNRQPDTQTEHPLENEATQQRCGRNSDPWNKYRLTLHCTIDTYLLTLEGTKQICQEKLAKRSKELESRSQKSKLDEDQALNRELAKQERLHNAKNFRRSQRPLYEGNSDILVAVSFNLAEPATVAVVRGSDGAVLAYRSIRQLLGENYRLLNRQRQQQQRHAGQRRKNQQKGASKQLSESELGLYVDRLIAKEIITLAKQFQAGSIVLPNLKGLRERIQSELEAKAERKIPGNRAKQALYAKEYRRQVHRWSHHRLAQNIHSQSAKVGIIVELGYQPFQGSPQEKARDLAIAAYHARQIAQ